MTREDRPDHDDESFDQEESFASDRFARPVAVGGDTGDDWGAPAYQRPEEPDVGVGAPEPEPGAPEVERPGAELLTGLAAAVLAASVFLPWYKTASYAGAPTISGWQSGTWGPVVFFLALAAIAVVALRRLRVAVAFPLEHGVVLELIGWISVAAVLLKRFFPPKLGATAIQYEWRGITVALLGGAGLALLASRLSPGPMFVVRPGWLRSTAGKLGAALLVVAIAAGAAFGLTNEPFEQQQAAAGAGRPALKPEQGFPKCGQQAKFPRVAGVAPKQGYQIPQDPNRTCVMIFSTSLSPKQAAARYEKALRSEGWKTKRVPVAGQARSQVLQITKPRCGTLTAFKSPTGKQTDVQAFITKCQPAAQGQNQPGESAPHTD